MRVLWCRLTDGVPKNVLPLKIQRRESLLSFLRRPMGLCESPTAERERKREKNGRDTE